MKKILIIGGEGYIGNAVCDFLIKKKIFKIISFDNLIYNQKRIRKNSKMFTFIKGDIRNEKDVKKIYSKYDAIIFLAGLVGDPITNKYKKTSITINEVATKKIIKNVYNFNRAKKFIFISTCSNYGLTKSRFLKENHPLKPLSLYAKSKVKMEKYILSLKRKDSFKPTILRFATAFGISNRMRFDLTINQFTKDLRLKKFLDIYDYNTWRPYCHVKDFARLIYLVLTKKSSITEYQVFNAGNNVNNYTKKQIGKKIQKFTGGQIKFIKKSQDKRNYIVDFSKVKKLLKFKTKYSVEFGIKEILKSLDKNNKKNFIYDNLGNYKISNKFI